jgi:hypothetical protein
MDKNKAQQVAESAM